MLMLYNSDNFVVVEHAVPDEASVVDVREPSVIQAQALDPHLLTRGGFEIVDKSLRREIYLEGALAEQFRQGVQALMDGERTPEAFDAFIEQYAGLAAVPLALH
jgi:Protein of unknown function (DUF3567)